MYRPLFDQATASAAGEFQGETDEQRDQRFAEVDQVGQKVLQDFAEMLGGVTEEAALTELLACLYVRSFTLDEEAKASRPQVSPFKVFDQALRRARWHLDMACNSDRQTVESSMPTGGPQHV